MNRLKPKTIRLMERKWALQREAVELLDIIAMEFKTDHQSVKCFDKRVVDRAIAVSNELKNIGETF